MPFYEGFVIWKVVFAVRETNWLLRTLLSGWPLPAGRVAHVSRASRTGHHRGSGGPGGLESCPSSPRYQESLTYLVYAYQSNTKLLLKGASRGVNESLITLYRRKCLLVGTEERVCGEEGRKRAGEGREQPGRRRCGAAGPAAQWESRSGFGWGRVNCHKDPGGATARTRPERVPHCRNLLRLQGSFSCC